MSYGPIKTATLKMSLVEIIAFFFIAKKKFADHDIIRQPVSIAVFATIVKYTFCSGVYICVVPVDTSFSAKAQHSLDKPSSQDVQPCD